MGVRYDQLLLHGYIKPPAFGILFCVWWKRGDPCYSYAD